AAQHEDELAAAVRRRRLALGLRHLDDDALGERLAEILRQIGHRLEVEDRLAVDPHRELAAAIARCAELHREILQLGRQEPDEVYARHEMEDITSMFSTGAVVEPWITVCVSGWRERFYSRLDHLAHSMSTCEPASNVSICWGSPKSLSRSPVRRTVSA